MSERVGACGGGGGSVIIYRRSFEHWLRFGACECVYAYVSVIVCECVSRSRRRPTDLHSPNTRVL